MNNKSGDMVFQVVTIDQISETDYQNLDKYYLPMLGRRARDLYCELAHLVNDGDHESAFMELSTFAATLELKESEYKQARQRLEAVGLLDTYLNINKFFYELHAPLRPSEFFNENNITLLSILFEHMGEEAFHHLQNELLITQYDYRKYDNKSKSVDDVYQVQSLLNDEYSLWWQTIRSASTRLKKRYFDYEIVLDYFEQRHLMDPVYLHSTSFYQLINNVSFCYQLSTDEIISCITYALRSDKTFSERSFIKQVKRVYTEKVDGIKNSPVIKVQVAPDNELIKKLDKLNTNDIVKERTGVGLVASEVATIETLMRVDGYSLGFVNCLTIYVLEKNDKVFPSINYFRKIGNTWIRQGVKTTEDAYKKLISGEKTNFYPSAKKQKAVPKWLDEKMNQPITSNDKPKLNDEEIVDLNDLFARKEK